jgi:hypothetical protein
MLKVRKPVMMLMRLPSILKMKSSVRRQRLTHKLKKLLRQRRIRSGQRISQTKRS